MDSGNGMDDTVEGGSVNPPTASGDGITPKKRGRRPRSSIEVKRLLQGGSSVTDKIVRDRKRVQRFTVDPLEPKKKRVVVIQKGQGISLKDIPLVMSRISRRNKNDLTLKVLHSILYGRFAKTPDVRKNILDFSGFVWGPSKNSEKVEEKLRKLPKETLMVISNFLALPLNSKKKDIVSQLLEFLEAPYVIEGSNGGQSEQRKPASGKGEELIPIIQKEKKMPGRKKGHASSVTSLVEEEKKGYGNITMEINEAVKNEKEATGKQNSDAELRQMILAKAGRKTGKNNSRAKTKQPQNLLSNGDHGKVAATHTKVRKNQKVSKDLNSANASRSIAPCNLTGEGKPKRGRPPKTSYASEPDGRQRKISFPSELELSSAIRKLIEELSLDTATLSDVIDGLGRKFNMNFSGRKNYLKGLVQIELAKIAMLPDTEDVEESG